MWMLGQEGSRADGRHRGTSSGRGADVAVETEVTGVTDGMAFPGPRRSAYSIDGPSLLVGGPGARHRWPSVAVLAASMTHRCGCPRAASNIDGPSLRQVW